MNVILNIKKSDKNGMSYLQFIFSYKGKRSYLTFDSKIDKKKSI